MRLEDIKIQNEVPDVISFINNLFDSAIQENASDIHIEPTRLFLLFRFRKDGDFLLKHRIWLDNSSAIVTRLKVMAKLKIDENKKPQDGKIVYSSERLSQTIDIRTATLPVTYGEKIVMRILKQDATNISLESVGFYEENLVKVREVLKSKYGIILVAWPTGSWKSTTLYAALSYLNNVDVNITTYEDPVENKMDWLNQSQVRADIWYTFAHWLRAALRQDPDIIMVWEIRDWETLETAMEAAMTWHLVFSTIHTNSAAETITRMMNMGAKPYMIAWTFNLVMAQRLWRKICSHCKSYVNVQEQDPVHYSNAKNVLSKMDKELLQKELILRKINIEENWAPFVKEWRMAVWTWKDPATGWVCPVCGWTWYKWRVWLVEILEFSDDIKNLLLQWKTAFEIEEYGLKKWMINLERDWIFKAIAWHTTLEEVYRLTKHKKY